MDASLLEQATAVWAVLSAVAVAGLGLFRLAGRSTRPPGTVAFAAFSTCWAAHVIAGQWMSNAGGWVSSAHLLYLAFLIPLPFFLVEFASAYAWRSGTTVGVRALRLAAAGVGSFAAFLLLVSPDLLYRGVAIMPDGAYPRWGPAFLALGIVPLFAAFGFALLAFDRARRQAPTAQTAQRYALLAGGIATFAAFSAGDNLSFYWTDLANGGTAPNALTHALLFAVLSAVVVTVGLRSLADARRATSRALARPALLVAAATLAPFGWGLVEGGLAYGLLPRFSTVGIWRLVGVGLLAYALARWRIPDLPERVRRGVATTAGVAAAVFAGGFAAGLAVLVASGPFVEIAVASAIPIATVAPSVQLARRALAGESRPIRQDADLARRVETYRAALEASVARESLIQDEAFLLGLRARLGLGDEVHAVLLTIVRSTVLPCLDEPYGAYERLRLLGEGAHGRAWLARRRAADDELVVLKECFFEDPRAKGAFVALARRVRAIRHPHVVRIHEIRDMPRGVLVVMEFVMGGTLADKLAPLPPSDAARVVHDVLSALDALHRRGIVHGDIKAANVLMELTGEAKLADFGLARVWHPDITRTQLPHGGTLAVVAPEQLRGMYAFAPPTPQSDVYAVGALLFRLLTGEHYVDLVRVDESRARERVRFEAPRLPHPNVPPGLEAVLRRALAKDPAQRYATAAAMRSDLAAHG